MDEKTKIDTTEELKTKQSRAHDFMRQAFKVLGESSVQSRESALARTKLEEAIMWNNKDRAILGELEKSETHVG